MFHSFTFSFDLVSYVSVDNTWVDLLEYVTAYCTCHLLISPCVTCRTGWMFSVEEKSRGLL